MSWTTQSLLEFQLAHARARDAVLVPLDFPQLALALAARSHQTIRLRSRATDRQTYLQRPDKGRLLDDVSAKKLKQLATGSPPPDVALVIADGLSSKAIDNHVCRFIELLVPELHKKKWKISPICLVQQGRVAIGDHIGEILSAAMTVVMIGERPGLSSPDSMGIYFTFRARRGVTDADRNCISNIHGNGLSHETALQKILYLMGEADRLKLSGVNLKEDTSPTIRPLDKRHKSFLLSD